MIKSRTVIVATLAALLLAAAVALWRAHRWSRDHARIFAQALELAAADRLDSALDQYRHALRRAPDRRTRLELMTRLADALEDMPPRPLPAALERLRAVTAIRADILQLDPAQDPALGHLLALRLAAARNGALTPADLDATLALEPALLDRPGTGKHRAALAKILAFSARNWEMRARARERVEQHLRAGIEALPDDPMLPYLLGRCRLTDHLLVSGHRRRATPPPAPAHVLAPLRAFVEQYPQPRRGRVLLATLLLECSRVLDAAECRDEAVGLLAALEHDTLTAPDPELGVTIAKLIFAAEHDPVGGTPASETQPARARAEALLRATIGAAPGNRRARLALAKILHAGNRENEGEVLLRQLSAEQVVAKADIGARDAQYTEAALASALATMLLDRSASAADAATAWRCVAEAEDTLVRLRDILQHPGFDALTQAQLAWSKRLWLTAAHAADRADRQFGGRNADAVFLSAAALERADQTGAATARYARFMRLSEPTPPQRRLCGLALARIALDKLDFTTAMKHLDRTEMTTGAAGPEYARLRLRARIGSALVQGEYGRDPELLRKLAADLEPAAAAGDTEAVRQLAELHLRTGDRDRAEALLAEYCQRYPGVPEVIAAWFRTAQAMPEGQHAETARAHVLAALTDVEPSDAATRLRAALEAEPVPVRAVLALIPLAWEQDPLARDVGLCRYDLREGREREAAQTLARLRTTSPEAPAVLALRFETALAQNDFPGAKAILAIATRTIEEPPRLQLWQARLAEAQARPEAALEAVDRVLAQWPLFGDAWSYHGQILLAAQRADEALESFERALSLRPGEPLASTGMFRISHARGLHYEALEFLRTALIYNPGDSELLRLFFEYRARHGSSDLALQGRLALAEIRPWDVENRLDLARLYLQLDRPESAQHILNVLLEEDPNDLRVVQMLARALGGSEDRPDAALAAFKAYIDSRGSQASARDWLAYAQAAAVTPGQQDLAAEAYAQAMQLDAAESGPVSLAVADWHLRRNAPERALAILRTVRARSGDLRVTASLGIAEALRQLGRHDQAEAECRTLMGNPDLSPREAGYTAWTQARILAATGRRPEAIAACSRAIALLPKAPEPLLLRAHLRQDSGSDSTDAVKADLEHALELDPDSVPGHEQLAAWYLENRLQPNAIKHLLRLIELRSGHLPYRLRLADLYSDLGHAARLEALLDEAEPLFPEAPELAWRRGRLLLSRREFAESVRRLAAAFAQQPTAPIPCDYADALLALGRPRDVLAILDTTPAAIRNAPGVITVRAQALSELGRSAEAADAFFQALAASSRDPARFFTIADRAGRALAPARWRQLIEALAASDNTAPVRCQLACLLLRAGRHEQGIQILQRLVAELPAADGTRQRALWLLGNAYIVTGAYAQAADIFQLALDHDPADPALLNNLATALIHVPGRRAEARAVAEKALAYVHDDTDLHAQCLATLGNALFHSGQFEAAARTLHTSLAARDLPVARTYLAEVLLAQKQPERALEQIRKAKTRVAVSEPHDATLRETIARVEAEITAIRARTQP